jgi:hypothetical protein
MPIGRPEKVRESRKRRTPHKRITLRARHIINALEGAKHSSVQRVSVNELAHEVDRHHTVKRAPAMAVGGTGFWVKLSPKALHALRRLRHVRNWKIQQQLVHEVRHEVTRAEKRAELALRLRQAAARRARWALARARSARRWSWRLVRGTGGWFANRGRDLGRISRAEVKASAARRAAKTRPAGPDRSEVATRPAATRTRTPRKPAALPAGAGSAGGAGGPAADTVPVPRTRKPRTTGGTRTSRAKVS